MIWIIIIIIIFHYLKVAGTYGHEVVRKHGGGKEDA